MVRFYREGPPDEAGPLPFEAPAPSPSDNFLSRAQGKWSLDRETAKKEIAARNRAKNPPAIRPTLRWQNPHHSAKDDPEWDDTDEMERMWGRGGITRGQAFQAKWQGRWPLDRRGGHRGRGGYRNMPTLIMDSDDDSDDEGNQQEETGAAGPQGPLPRRTGAVGPQAPFPRDNEASGQQTPLTSSSFQDLLDRGYHL